MILVLDDHPVVGEGICSVIKKNKKDEEIFYAGKVEEAIDIMEENEISLAFIDLNLKEESGFHLIRWIRKQKLDSRLFVITSSSHKSDFKRAQELDVDAYVLKDAFIDEITFAIDSVERGGKYYSSLLVDQMSKCSEDENALSLLTNREMEVLYLLGQGYYNERINETLFISEGTTKKHIGNILNKLQMRNRVEAVLFAVKNSYSIYMAVEEIKSNI